MVKRNFGHNSGETPRSVLSPSKRGYQFQFSLTRRILDRLGRFRSVTAKTMSGDVITSENLEKIGRDGGLDLVIEIESVSRKSALQTASKVKKVLKTIDRA
jgi:hypothetical protein